MFATSLSVLSMMLPTLGFADFSGSDGSISVSTWTGQKAATALSASAASNLAVEICEDSFPVGSQNRVNMEAALNGIENIPGVAIDFTWSYVSHREIKNASPAANTVWVDYVPFPSSLEKKIPMYVTTGCSSASCPSGNDWGKIEFNRMFFNANPTGDTALSVAAISSALGQLFGEIRPNERTNSSYKMFAAMTSVGYPQINGDDRIGSTVHAWDMYQLRTFYPDTNLGDLGTDELTIHPIITYYKDSTSLFREGIVKKFNPRRLRWNSTKNGGNGAYTRCGSNEYPNYVVQWSENSTNTTNKNYKVRLYTSKVSNPNANNDWNQGAEVNMATRPAGHTNDFYQYRWVKGPLVITGTMMNTGAHGPASLVQRQIRFEVDPTGAVTERDENNNSVRFEVCLYPESDTSCSAVCNLE